MSQPSLHGTVDFKCIDHLHPSQFTLPVCSPKRHTRPGTNSSRSVAILVSFLLFLTKCAVKRKAAGGPQRILGRHNCQLIRANTLKSTDNPEPPNGCTTNFVAPRNLAQALVLV